MLDTQKADDIRCNVEFGGYERWRNGGFAHRNSRMELFGLGF